MLAEPGNGIDADEARTLRRTAEEQIKVETDPTKRKALVVDAKTNANLVRGAKNLAASQWLAPEGINVYDILRHETLVLTKAAVESITASLKDAE